MQKLRKEIELAFGRKIIANSDIIELQNKIEFTTHQPIANSTLRRLFKLVKYEGRFSAHTINTLNEYVNLEKTKHSKTRNHFAADWLIHVFHHLDKIDINDRVLLQAIRSFYAVQAKQALMLSESIMFQIAKNELGRRVFYDQFVNLDELENQYGKGLEYYIKFEKLEEHRAFALSLLCLKAWTLSNAKQLSFNFSKLPNFSSKFHPFIQGRIRAALVLNNPQESQILLQEQIIMDINNQYPTSENYKNFPGYELTLLEAFKYTDNKKMGKWLSEQILLKWEHRWLKDKNIDPGYYNALKLLMLSFFKSKSEIKNRILMLQAPDCLPLLATEYYSRLIFKK